MIIHGHVDENEPRTCYIAKTCFVLACRFSTDGKGKACLTLTVTGGGKFSMEE